MPFTHLHVHTEYSLLDSSNKIKEYVAQVKALGMDSAAITDHGVMYGVIDFYKEAMAAGVKPIIGCEVYVAPGSRFDRETGSLDDRYYHMVLLAENNTGYANLVKLVSHGFTEGFYYRPRIDRELLEKYHEGIIALSACLAGEIPRNILREDYDGAKAAALSLAEIFGPEHFYLELQDHGMAEQKKVNAALVRMSRETGLPLVATNDVHYTYKEDVEPHDLLLCIQTGKKVDDEDRMRYTGGQYYLKSPEEMADLFPYAPEAIKNTEEIAARCHVEIEFGVTKLPKFALPEGVTSEEYLRKLCFDGLHRKYGTITEELTERLEYELSTIRNMGYVDYFLIVWDFIRFARSAGIMVGPGRGSAAGSLVSYTLDITQLDPLKYNLLFERFLNPERVSMPDIDVDFCFERRQEVIDYVVEKYGKDCVVQIVTFGTLQARGVIRDVGRVLNMPYAAVDIIAKMIPSELNITIDGALEKNPELKKAMEADPQVEKLITLAKRLEGLPRHTSIHAAGVVISGKPVEEYVPLSRAADGAITTQFTMTTLEELGLLKMDFLGLRTLTVLQNARLMAERSSGKSIDLMQIDFSDPEVYNMIGAGKCEGVFQLESEGMKSFMKELKPKNLEDIIAGIALYRPGPMDFIPKYIDGKNNADAIVYDCPQLEPILSATYGCIVYQEQVMQIVRDLAGYTLGRSDLVRRAMSKKKTAVMEKERQNFIYGNPEEGVAGCLANGISEEVANKIYDSMMDFAKYAFNKSHAAAYAIVSYQTAWLKHYYPVEFMAALMTSVIDNPGKVAGYILYCRQAGITILPPDINKSEGGFSVENGCIRYGLTAVKGIGKPVMEAICAERQENGPYINLMDFCRRLSTREVNKRTLENFIKAGAFDGFGSRRQLIMVYDRVMDAAAAEKKSSMTGQMSLFDLMSDEDRAVMEVRLPAVEEFSQEEKLAFEKEVLGIYVSGHPLEEYEDILRKTVTAYSTDFALDEETGTCKVRDNEHRILGGMITARTVKYTRQNKAMAFLTLEDQLGSVEVVVFPKDYERHAHDLEVDSKVFLSGRVSVEEDKAAKLIFEACASFDQTVKELWVQFVNREKYEEKVAAVYDCLKKYPGGDRTVLYLKAERAMKRLPARLNVDAGYALLGELSALVGEDNVRTVEKPPVLSAGAYRK